jgi:hypothetical protein
MDNRSPSCYSNAKCGIFFATTINYYVIILIKLLHLTAQVIIASGYTKLRTCNVAKILSADLIHLTGEMQNQQECLIALVFFSFVQEKNWECGYLFSQLFICRQAVQLR